MKSVQLIAAAFLVVATLARAEPPPSSPPIAGASASLPMTRGEVRKVDKEQGKLTLRHGPIANLEMPGMTMVFRVSDPNMLNNLKEGDKVRFSADRVNGAITVISIEFDEEPS
ncbi:MAG: copper-binding protein [Rhizobacter sp.]